ncbi:MAG: prephenate dehydrogenase/arogenate dehydrogenase family protein [Betaproteobacteria bacterium]|nr:prephenate dehydrogenase/arogenate dehydrogenase family protein [Betaproteobacteria bacterium]MDH4324392.1 prephenate dehydrogenase/arogenate dehydrogenase family protein [Betaproteobacteria bacterium]
MRFPKVAVVGVGLIGGSFALALKAAKACRQVVGVGRSAANLELARQKGIVDAIGAGVEDADLILIATPVAQYARVLSALAPQIKPSALVTDAGSTKRDVVAAARAALGKKIAQFVPAHPIAGAEKSGAGAAAAELFRGKRVVLTPLPENADATVQAVEEAWRACGARVGRMSPEEHDAVFAAVSHLPHLLAYALVHEVAARDNSAQLFGYAAGGFRDFTRIASSHPEMWRDICAANRDRLLDELDRYVAKLRAVRPLVESGDGAALEKLFAEARAARERWLNGEYE